MVGVNHHDEPLITEAVQALVANGVAVDTWTVLSRSNRRVLDLESCGLIAKIMRAEAHSLLAREISIAAHIVDGGGPAAPPASRPGPFLTSSVSVSVWNRLTLLGEPSESVTFSAYLDLRLCLDSYGGALPDFRDAIESARILVTESRVPNLTTPDVAFLKMVFDSSFESLSTLRWKDHALHGDPHTGNIALTDQGPRWLEFESACSGPLEWDLSALPSVARTIEHDPKLLAVLTRLRRACVVAWCAAKLAPSVPEREAIAHHLDELKLSR